MIQIKLITALISSVVGVMTMAPVAMSKPHRPVASCSLRYPDHCANINQLVGDPEFRKELSIVLADRREDLFHYKENTSTQVLAALSGPPDPSFKLRDGGYLFSGCRFQSCSEKAAVIIDASHHVSGVGVIYYLGTPLRRQPSRIIYQAGDRCRLDTSVLTRWSDEKLKDMGSGRAFAKTAVIRVRAAAGSRRACPGKSR
jgi:hypothetical protein